MIFRFAVKLGLAGGAVYYVADQGVWKDSTETTKLFEKINEGLKPYLQEAKAQIPIEVNSNATLRLENTLTNYTFLDP